MVEYGIDVIAPDLPGHGLTTTPPEPSHYSITSKAEFVDQIIQQIQIKPIAIYGYSMGARVALHLLQNRMEITGTDLNIFIIESGNPGLDNITDQRDRVKRDSEIARSMQYDYIGFLEQWNRLPLFRSPFGKQSPSLMKFYEVQRAQDPLSMSLSFEYSSPGRTITKTTPFKELKSPLNVITGEMDEKYCNLWEKISSKYLLVKHHIIPDAGHRVHLDNPNAVSKLLISLIKP